MTPWTRTRSQDTLDEDAFAVRETDKVRANLLLCLVGVGNVVESFEIERIPEIALRGDGAAHAPEGVPFRIAYLGALYAAPPLSVTVDDALTGDADIRPLAGGDARHGLAVLQMRRPVGRQEDHRIPLQMQVDMVFQGDGTGDEDAGRHDEVPAPLLRQGADGLREGVSIVRQAVTDAAEFLQAQRVVRNYRQLGFHHFPRHGGGQIVVISRIIPRRGADRDGQKG